MDILGIVLAILGLVGGVVSIIQVRIWWMNWLGSRIAGFSAIERDGLILLSKIEHEGFTPQVVIGLGRSGAFLGGWLAGNIGSVPIEVVDRMHSTDSSSIVEFPHWEKKLSLLLDIYGETASVLIVEGATTWGGTFHHFEIIRKAIAPKWSCKYCVLYEVDTCKFPIAFTGKVLDKAPSRYPWHKTSKYRTSLRRSRLEKRTD